jgi:hypothetical protein
VEKFDTCENVGGVLAEEGDERVLTMSQFMFVNKDASNVMSRSSKEAYFVNSHVQLVRNKPSKTQINTPDESSKLDESVPSNANTVNPNKLVREHCHLESLENLPFLAKAFSKRACC